MDLRSAITRARRQARANHTAYAVCELRPGFWAPVTDRVISELRHVPHVECHALPDGTIVDCFGGRRACRH